MKNFVTLVLVLAAILLVTIATPVEAKSDAAICRSLLREAQRSAVVGLGMYSNIEYLVYGRGGALEYCAGKGKKEERAHLLMLIAARLRAPNSPEEYQEFLVQVEKSPTWAKSPKAKKLVRANLEVAEAYKAFREAQLTSFTAGCPTGLFTTDDPICKEMYRQLESGRWDFRHLMIKEDRGNSNGSKLTRWQVMTTEAYSQTLRRWAEELKQLATEMAAKRKEYDAKKK